MAGESHILGKLQTLLMSFDDSAFEALANRGLLRRAQKDLEGGVPVEVTGDVPAGLAVKVADFTITIPEAGPAKAKCTCRSPGVCQHILVACLFLQRTAALPKQADLLTVEATTTGRGRDELLAFTTDQLGQWAGKPVLRAALALLAAQPPIQTETKGAIIVRFPDHGAECRYVAGGGLDGMVVTAPQGTSRKFAVAAVLAFQQSQGLKLPEAATTAPALAEARGAPRTRGEVLDTSRQLLEESVCVGLSHLSTAFEQRFATLAVSALGVNLPRLSLALRGIADEISLIVKRDAQADEARVLQSASRAYALCHALHTTFPPPRADLIGWHRTQYEEVGHLELHGVAAYPWRTSSGYEGLTVLFWENTAHRWYSWSEARPRHQAGGFNPRDRYQQESPWQGTTSPDQLSRSSFKLMHARRNPPGRLSASAKSRALIVGPTSPATLNFGNKVFSCWSSLRQYACELSPIGLGEFNPLDEIVVLQPASWGRRHFDQVSQAFTWAILDEDGDSLALEVRFNDLNNNTIKFLENLDPRTPRVSALIAKISRTSLTIAAQPISLLMPEAAGTAILNLGFDTAPCQIVLAKLKDLLRTEADEEPLPADEDGEKEEFVLPGSSFDRLITDLESLLQNIAERGCRSLADRTSQELRTSAVNMEAAGLNVLSKASHRLIGNAGWPASDLLQLRYLCLVHRQAGQRIAVRTA